MILDSCKSKKTQIDKVKKNEVVSIEAVELQSKIVDNTIEVNGSIIPNEFTEIRAEVAGRITKIYFKEGTFVKEGTLLVQLFDDDLQANLKKYKAQLDLKIKSAERIKKLLDANGINVQEYDDIQNQIASLKSDIDFVNAQISKTKIVAPFSGQIGLRNVSQGAFLSANSIITTLQQIDQLKIDFNVPENFSNNIKIGNKIKYLVDANKDTNLASIIAIEPVINQNTRNLKVRAKLETSSKTNNLAGKFAKVLIKSENTNKSILIPTQAIIPDNKLKKVFVIKNGIANQVVITTGIRKDNDIQVLSGLNEKDTIAITGILYLRPKSKVKLKKVQIY